MDEVIDWIMLSKAVMEFQGKYPFVTVSSLKYACQRGDLKFIRRSPCKKAVYFVSRADVQKYLEKL
jgi:hypothetical protein